MEIRPILSTLLRNKSGAMLIALQIALTMAVVINAAFVIADRANTIAKPTGVDSDHLTLVRALQANRDVDVRSVIERDVAALMALDGVQTVAKISTITLSNSGSSSSWDAQLSTASTADRPRASLRRPSWPTTHGYNSRTTRATSTLALRSASR